MKTGSGCVNKPKVWIAGKLNYFKVSTYLYTLLQGKSFSDLDQHFQGGAYSNSECGLDKPPLSNLNLPK